MDKRPYLTTIDNPYSPKDQFDLWLAFDMRNGYNSSEYLDRIMPDTSDYTPKARDEAKELAIDEIVSMDLYGGKHVKVFL